MPFLARTADGWEREDEETVATSGSSFSGRESRASPPALPLVGAFGCRVDSVTSRSAATC